MARAALQLLLLFGLLICSDSQFLYQKQPRLRTQDGNLLIVSAKDKNITLQTLGSQSFVNINGMDLVGLASQAKIAVQQVNDIQNNYLVATQTKLDSLSIALEGDEGLTRRTNNVESTLLSLSQNVTKMSTRLNRRMTTMNSRVLWLEKNLRMMRRNLKKNECNSNPCQNGGTCEDAFKAFKCRCPTGWEGPTCANDVDECARFIGTDLGCQNGATCQNTQGGYKCQCQNGFSGLHCTLSSSNCSTSSAAELCGHGMCIPTRVAGRSYTCFCDQGWKADPISGACTVDVNECEMLGRPACSVHPAVPCVNTPGSFHCGFCPPGYTGNGYYCADIDECLTSNGGCSENPKAVCINTMGSRVCGSCPSGFTGDGINCVASRPCDSNNGGCHPMARCYDNPSISVSFVQCICPRGYNGNGFGPSGCVLSSRDNDSDVCVPNPCRHGNCYPSADLFTCACNPGYAGTLCDTPIMDVCHPNPCQNNGVCTAQNGRTFCSCSSGFTGPQCQFRTAKCGGTYNADSGVISYSTKYDQSASDFSCLWRINVNDSLVLKGRFSNFNVSKSPSCDFDWIQIHDGPRPDSPLMGTFCGGKPPPLSITSAGNSLLLWYHSPAHTVDTKFEFQWNASLPACGGILMSQQGTIKSPGFPGKYPTNRNCTWIVKVSQGKRVILNIFSLQLQQSVNCGSDYLEVRDGLVPTSRLLRKICNSSSIAPITSTGSILRIIFHSDNTSSPEEQGFEMAFTELTGVEGCGGVWTTSRGQITSPNYPQLYSGNLYCEYLIQLPINERIRVQFLDLKIEASAGCTYDSLEIREGSSENSPLVSKICGNEIPSAFTSSGNEILFIFRTDASSNLKGFKLRYDTACGGTLTAANGMFSSPNYPNEYPSGKTCIFKIALPLHRAIVLQFLDMEFEKHDRCIHDYVEIRDGPDETSQFLGRFCGNSSRLPPITLSSRNHLWVKFKSDSTMNFKGFAANYSSVDTTCGGILSNESGNIISTNDGKICKYVIHVPRGSVIRLTWTKIRSDSSTNSGNIVCDSDFVQVFDNSSTVTPSQQIGMYCGTKLPPTLTSQGNIMTVVLNQLMSDSEFELTYFAIKSSTLCGGNYYTTYGLIKSPNFPRKYASDLDCVYTIQVPNGQQIGLNFTFFDMENSTDCAFDYVEIRNGPSATSPLVGTFCGNTKPPVIPSHGNSLWLRFHSDNSLSARGWRAIWDGTATGCGGVLRSLTGHIESPNYPQPYGVNAECIWTIYVAKGNTISLAIIDLDIERTMPSNPVCYDYIEIIDGDAIYNKTLAKFCNSQNSHHQILSSGNSLRIVFKTDASDSGRGFSLRYRTECNNHLRGHRGVIESPNFPDDYPHLSNCTWIVHAPPGNKINVSFTHFSLEKIDSSCSVDYIKLRTGVNNATETKLIGTYCSSDANPGLITSEFNTLYLDFVTDFSVAYGGFRMEWVVHGCGGSFDAPYGSLKTPNYPSNYPANTECRWEIAVDWDKSVELTILDLSIESSGECNFDSLTVYNGQDESAPVLTHLCAFKDRALKVTSSGRYMTVIFKSDNTHSGKGFSAYYRSAPFSCGGRMISNQGGIHSKNFPENFDKNTECNWLIQVDINYIVKLEFTEFDVPKINNSCDSQYVAVWDGASPFSATPMFKFCGNEIPPIINSTTSVLRVRMVTANSDVAKGFSAKYRIDCGATILAYHAGELKSTSIMTNLDVAETITKNCTWIIIASEPTSHVNLALTHLDLEDNIFSLNHSICTLQYLEVRDGIGLTAPLVGKYCNKKIPPHIVSNGQALTVNLVTLRGPTTAGSNFIATYSIDGSMCGGTLIAEEGSFASPGYPGSYSSDSECIWKIGASPGNKLELTFSMFDLETSDSCNNDYLEIRVGATGGDPLLGVYCGNQIPNNITASNKLWIKFKSDSINVGSGFLAHYTLKHGGNLYGINGQLANPLYPQPFIGRGLYWWRINSRINGIKITFKEIYLNSQGCLTSMNIYDGYDASAPLLKQICEVHSIPEPILASGNVAFIMFKANPIYSGSQFLLEWSGQHFFDSYNMTTSGCGARFNVSVNGTVDLKSPGFPFGYAPNLLCEWVFDVPPTFHAALYFHTLNLEQQTTCNYDYVAVYSGSRTTDSWKLLKKLCHPNATQVHGIHGSDLMKVVFKTDSMQNKTGFSASVIAVCGSNLEGPNGYLNISSLTTPANFGMRPMCEWNVTVRPGRTIKVDIDSLYITGGVNCRDGYLMLKNGHSQDSPLLGEGRYCGSIPPATTLETSSNKLYIRYNNRQLNDGFKLNYKETSSNCGGLYNFQDGTGPQSLNIKSPNYPKSPLTNTECEWIIMAPPGKRLRIDFKERMSFIYSKNCELAYVEFFDGGSSLSPSLGFYCKDTPNSIITSDNALFVRYVTMAKEPRSGFTADISVDVCGGTIRTDMTTTIEVPNFSTTAPITCVWQIISEGNLLSYWIDSLNIVSEKDDNCTTNYVEVAEAFQAQNRIGKDAILQSENHKKYCGTNFNRTTVNTASDTLLIVLNSTRNIGRTSQKYFKMIFRSIHQECGGTTEASEGEISSPGYPNLQSKRQVCTWLITVPAGRQIKVEFIDFDLDGSRSICQQWLGIYNDHSSTLPIGLYCGGETPNEISSSSNKIMIQSLTWPTSTHRGFKIKFSSNEPSVCTGNILQNYGSLSFPNVNMSSIYCQWNRVVSGGTFAITIFNATINSNPDSSCFRSSRNLLIGKDTSYSLAQYCATISTPTLVTNPFPETLISAKQNSLENRISFNLDYSFNECGGLLYGPMDSIQSPKNMSMDCAWCLMYHYGQINLTIAVMNFTANCEEQYINIYNGQTSTWPLIGKYCKDNQPPSKILGQSGQMYIEYHGSSKVLPGSGFLINTTLAQRGCGGIFHTSKGMVVSPNYPFTYKNNSECEWEIIVDDGYHIGLSFKTRFFIEYTENCTKDFLEVFDYTDDAWKSLGRVCGRDIPKPFNSTGNRMKVLFRSDNMTTADGFLGIWTVNCGGVITASEGYLISPSYPANYGKFLSCKYIIKAPLKAIMFQFVDFSLEQGFQDCRYDNVTVKTHSPAKRQYRQNVFASHIYCGQDAPPDGISFNYLTVTFQTDKWIEKRGFRMKFIVDDCGGEINETNIAKHSVLSPQLFAVGQRSSINCTWTIKAPSNKNIKIRFENMNIKRSSKCLLGAVQLFNATWADSSYSVGTICGNITDDGRVFVSRSNALTMTYIAYRSFMRVQPFSAVISFTYGESVSCGGHINISQLAKFMIGSYSQRGIGGDYENMLDCRWYIRANSGDAVKFTVNNFEVKDDMVNSSTCSSDYLEIRDGSNQFSPLVGRFCNTSRPDTITSSGAWMYIRFVSDDYQTAKGFQAQLEKIPSPCGPQVLQVDSTVKELTSPGYHNSLTYAPNLRCRWKLRSKEVIRFDIQVTDLDIESSVGCENDKLLITEDAEPEDIGELIHTGSVDTNRNNLVQHYSPRADANHNSLFCGKSSNHVDWYSRRNYVDVIFSTNGAVAGKGFRLQYQHARCSRNFTNTYGRIHYQGQIENKKFDGECTVMITTDFNRTISLYFSELYSFKSMRLSNGSACNLSSSYKIYDGASTSSPLLAEYCGVSVPNPVFSTGPTLMLRAKQDRFWAEEGFDATYTTSDKGRGCGGVLRNVAGSLSSPLYPGRVKDYTQCVWEITVPEGSYVKIIFTDFNLGSLETCSTDHLKIYEVDTSNAVETFRSQLCGSDIPAPVSVNTNSILLKYTTSIHNSGTGWKINYAAKKSSP